MKFEIVPAIDKKPSEKRVPVRIRLEHSGDINLEVNTDGGWQVIAWINYLGLIKITSRPPKGFST